MRTYIISVAVTAIIATLADMLMPNENKKYIAALTGAMLLTALISPLPRLGKASLPELDFPSSNYIEFDTENEINAQFCSKIEADIKERLHSEFAFSCDARVEASPNDGVTEIVLDCGESSAVRARLCEVYGCENIKFNKGDTSND